MTKAMTVSIIAAMDEHGIIGKDNQLPWHLSADLIRFKKVTMGKPIIMGRKTHMSIGRPLPGRTNIVISRNPQYRAEGCVVVQTPEEALRAAEDTDEIMVIGGASIYRTFLPYTDKMYITRVHAIIDGDTSFPDINWENWEVVEQEDHEPDEKNPYAYSFLILKKKPT